MTSSSFFFLYSCERRQQPGSDKGCVLGYVSKTKARRPGQLKRRLLRSELSNSLTRRYPVMTTAPLTRFHLRDDSLRWVSRSFFGWYLTAGSWSDSAREWCPRCPLTNPSFLLPATRQTSLRVALTEPPVLQGLVFSCHAPNEFLQQAATEHTATTWWGLEGVDESCQRSSHPA